MKHLQKICLCCQMFRPTTTESGVCRLDKSKSSHYPVMGYHDNCDEWKTCGQQYYIRAGWLKKQLAQAGESSKGDA